MNGLLLPVLSMKSSTTTYLVSNDGPPVPGAAVSPPCADAGSAPNAINWHDVSTTKSRAMMRTSRVLLKRFTGLVFLHENGSAATAGSSTKHLSGRRRESQRYHAVSD